MSALLDVVFAIPWGRGFLFSEMSFLRLLAIDVPPTPTPPPGHRELRELQVINFTFISTSPSTQALWLKLLSWENSCPLAEVLFPEAEADS